MTRVVRRAGRLLIGAASAWTPLGVREPATMLAFSHAESLELMREEISRWGVSFFYYPHSYPHSCVNTLIPQPAPPRPGTFALTGNLASRLQVAQQETNPLASHAGAGALNVTDAEFSRFPISRAELM